ncbi:phage tail spike protein [Enterococcus saccharolyticus]|uniref:phage tail spike protein n=1 Tax=Enterococcus saccharolyticus TaxID=41997 RepID=UPI0039DF3C43
MNFYITDRKYNLIDIVSTDGNTDIVATVVKDTQSIEQGARDFEATMYFKDDDFKLAKKLSTVGNFILYKDRQGQSVFISIESREINATDCVVQITGKDASIDLINEVVGPYKPDKSYSIAEYILRFTSDSGFEIGENAIPNKKLKLEEWTSEATALERILSVATRFGVEISFSFEINGLDVIKRYINISEKRGSDENITLYANREIESITIKEDSYDLFTAIKPIGAIPEGKETPINLNGYKYTDPNGRYVLSGGILKDNKVVQEWSRLLSNEVSSPTGAHITRYKEYDTDSQSKLFTMAMTDLKKYAQLNVNYEVVFYEFPTSVSIGDTINLVDEDKEIYLSARVLTLSYDYISDTAEAVVGDYLIKDSGISKDLENLAASMKDKFANVNENLNGKAVIVKSNKAPEPNENTIWIDTSNPQTPIKTYDPETGEWLVSTGEAGKDGIAGKDGLGVLSTVITYSISASGTTTPSGGWTDQVPTLEKGKYLWTKTQWTYTDGSAENGYTVSYIAKDGNDGEDGYAGKDGVGILNTKVEYVGSTSGTTRPTTGWSTTIPTVAEGSFLWTRTTWTYTDNTSEMGYSVAKMGAKGDKGNDGIAGKDGKGINSTVITYMTSTSGTTAPTTGWTSTVPTLTKGQYLWTKTIWTYTDSTTETGYSVSYIAKDGNTGKDGIAGKDGVGISNTIIEYVGSVSGTIKPTSGWSTTIPTVPAGQYLWTRTTWQYTDGTSEQGFTNALMGRTGASGKDGVAGKDGVGIQSTQIMYAQSTSGTTAPLTGWTEQVPTLIKGQYLWTQTTWVYTDNTGEAGYTVSYNAKDGNNGTDGIAGKDGVGIAKTLIQYVGSTSGTTRPTSGWSTTIPTVAEGNYLWTKTTWTYTDGTKEEGFSVAKMGAKGDTGAKGNDGIAGKDGVGIKSTLIKYAQSTSGTISPSEGWSEQVPALVKGQYLWTRTRWTYTDNTIEDGYTVSYNAKDGNTGKDGIAGKDGVGIKTTTITYASSTSGTTKPTSGWTSSIPTVADGNYLWTKTVWLYTDNTSEAGYSVAKMGTKGVKGDKGDPGNQGIPGTPGADGRTPYTHWAYAWSADGTDRFTTTYPNENLLEDSISMSSFSTGTLTENAYLDTFNSRKNTKTIATQSGSAIIVGQKTITELLEPSTTYTVSFVARGNYVRTYVYPNVNIEATGSKGQSTSSADTGIDWILTNDWQEYSFTFTTLSTLTGTKNLLFRLDTNSVDTNAEVARVKLEKSSIMTLYTPSPSEDFNSAYPTYAGTYTDYEATDSEDPSKYTWQRILGESGQDGKDGIAGKDGVGIKNTAIQYASSTSGTTAPTTGWQTNVPTVSAGNYLWTKTTWTYTDNTTEVGYAVSRIGKDGNTGKDGIAGKDGTGIKATSIEYAGSTSGVNAPTSGWTATVPTVASGSYLWTKTTWSYTDDTNETGYSVARMGETGAKGDSATSYWITPSVNTIKISASKVLSPSTVTFTGYAKTGTANTVTYSGRFNVMTSTDGIVYSSVYVSTANQSTYTYPIPTTAKFIKVRMYQAGGTSVLLDEQTIPILESAEDLEIGARNLLKGTGDMSANIFAGVVDTTETPNGNVSVKRTFVSGHSDAYGARTTIPATATEYTISFWAKADRTIVFRNYFYSPDTTTKVVSSSGETKNSNGNGETYFTATTDWKKYWITWTQTPTTGDKQVLLGRLYSAGTIWINSPMLVEGNVPMPWTPAPEDQATQSQITQLSNQIDLRVTKAGLIGQINTQAGKVLIKANDNVLMVTPTTTYIQDSTIKNAHIADLAVTGAKIANATISSAKIISLDANKINANTLSAISANLGTVTAGSINGVNITGGTITQTSTGGYSLKMNSGRLDMFRDTTQIMSITPTYSSATSKPNGAAIVQTPGEIFSINTKNKTSENSTAVFQIPSTSHSGDVRWNLFGQGNGIKVRSINIGDDGYSREIFADPSSNKMLISTEYGLIIGHRQPSGGHYEFFKGTYSNIDLHGGGDNYSSNMGAGISFGRDGSTNAGGNRIWSKALYNRTYSSAANLFITSEGTLGRVTSALKYKTDVRVANDVIQNAHNLLSIQPKSWFDKTELADKGSSKRYYGFIADEFDALGLSEVVVYGESGQVESLAYDRISMYHNVILNDHEQQLASITQQLNTVANSRLQETLLLESRLLSLQETVEQLQQEIKQLSTA